ASDDRVSSGAYKSPHTSRPTRKVSNTRPAGIARRRGVPWVGASAPLERSSTVGSFVPVAMSELEVDERGDPSRAERRYHEEYDRDRDAQRDGPKVGDRNLEAVGRSMGDELRPEPDPDRQDHGRRDQR